MRDALSKNVHQKHYISGNGLPKLREAIAKFYKNEFNFIEESFYPHIRDLNALVITNLAQNKSNVNILRLNILNMFNTFIFS